MRGRQRRATKRATGRRALLVRVTTAQAERGREGGICKRGCAQRERREPCVPPVTMGEHPGAARPTGVRMRFGASDGSRAVSWPRFSEKLCCSFVTLTGGFVADAHAAIGDASGLAGAGVAAGCCRCGSASSLPGGASGRGGGRADGQEHFRPE